MEMKQHHESANVTVACSHEDIVSGHTEDRQYNSSTEEYVFKDSVRGLNLDTIIEDGVKDDSVDDRRYTTGKSENSVARKGLRQTTGSTQEKEHQNVEKMNRLEIHLELAKSEIIRSSGENNSTTNEISGVKNGERKSGSCKAIDIPKGRNHSWKSNLSESPEKSPIARQNLSDSPKKINDHNFKSLLSESPNKLLDANEDHHVQYLRPGNGRNSKSARSRTKSDTPRSRSGSRSRSASPRKAQKENLPNTKRNDSNFYISTPKSLPNRQKYTDYLSEFRNGQNVSRLKERRHSSGQVLLTRNRKENESRPVTAATTFSKVSSAQSRRSSIPQGKFSKQELEQYLPRKSFFDCHEKALKERENNSEEASAKLRKKREIALERIQNEETRRFEANASITKLGKEKNSANKLDEADKAEKVEESPVTAVSTLDQPIQPKQVTKKKSKKKLDDEEEIHVDHSILLHYLRFIRDHPDDYVTGRDNMYQATHQHSESRSEDSLIKMAHIFERGHHGEQTDGLLVQAVHEIRPQFFETSETGQNADEAKSEYEKHRTRIDKWLRSISTAQLNKAKELALRDMGDEDQAQTKWWLALRSCHYIRHPEEPSIIRNPLQ